MDAQHLYQQIAAAVRGRILNGELQPGDRLPPVRAMAAEWDCTTGTVQRAYQELAGQGLIESHPGRGTMVAGGVAADSIAPLRRAQLVHRAETFLLEVLGAGYSLPEVESAVQQAFDRWRATVEQPQRAPEHTLRFAGSHDLVLTWLASRFHEIVPGYSLQLAFSGSLGGLIALAEGRADLAGCHLWDAETESYNRGYVQRLLPGRRVALVTLADRRLGLILAPGNPHGLRDVAGLARPGLRFVNRQPGSGTRVWLDNRLHDLDLDPGQIKGYLDEKTTHLAVAQAIVDDQADAGIGLEAAALSYGLAFIPLTSERYHLVIPGEAVESAPVAELLAWLSRPETKSYIEALGGYDAGQVGEIEWVG